MCMGGVILSCSNNSDGGSAAPLLIYRTVTFNSDGGSEVAAKKVLNGSKVEKPADPTKTGYAFGGWFKGNDAYDFDKAVNEDVTLTARWTAKTYTVTLQNGEGADPASSTVTATYGQKLPDLASLPTILGSTFGGYYTERQAEGTKLIDKDGKGCAEWTFDENKTLYAAFGYAITYNNTKDVANSNPDIYIQGKGLATLAALDGTSIGYTFGGWSRTDGGSPIPEGEAAIAADATGAKTFYALWTPIQYQITYEGLDGGTHTNATNYTVETATINFADAVKENSAYASEGWFDAATGGNKVESIPQGSTGNKTLYARWLLGTKASPSEVGDIVFNNGRAVAYSAALTLDDAAKAAAVAVIFDAANKKGVGLKEGTVLYWAAGTGVDTTFDTSDSDGSVNWAVIQAADPTGAETAATNYPAFNFCNTYNVAVAGVSTGWYLPAKDELYALLNAKAAVDASIEKIGESGDNVAKLGASILYWSSSQYKGGGNHSERLAYGSYWGDYQGGTVYTNQYPNKASTNVRPRAIRKF